jgi:hypothetical protein
VNKAGPRGGIPARRFFDSAAAFNGYRIKFTCLGDWNIFCLSLSEGAGKNFPDRPGQGASPG